ncbi:class I SAM-dependent methyltransferase [Streptomyces sp. NA04227]|uniref:SAM-dependent methyltransferase n=1 Tax=Streptomyces sp. NA04227 TaxID=2742136 RepID=UPI001590C4CD|nr:cyclopropane-fatty-acyl-phospholipid synthase family protein [Streptomyces sp. NA04227]QKW10467.1 class I SAM-dependent methyltransferase [Streptomyces sp. NA04227]
MTVTRTAPTATTTAARLALLAEHLLGEPLPVQLKAWDDSRYGPPESPVLYIRSRLALRRLLWQPGELGLAEGYISGEIDVEGDLKEALRLVRRAVHRREPNRRGPSPAALARVLPVLVGMGAAGLSPAAPGSRARLKGPLHSRARDRAAIGHHYDLSNAFYQLLLDETMAYSCGYWTSERAGYTGVDAQHDKLELICRKLALGPGSRLLDIGCGWGALALHAAGRHGVRVTAVTLSAQQAAHLEDRVRAQGLTGHVEVECHDYRDIRPGQYDAVASIEMGEHVGDARYPAFARALYERVRPGGRVLVQQMSRGASAPGGGAFIERYIAPDMHMRPLGRTVCLLEDAGLEVCAVQSLREHYVRTVEEWRRTLESRRARFADLVGEETTRVWQLYLAGGALAFEEGRMGVDQILAVRREQDGGSGMPPTCRAWYEDRGPLDPDAGHGSAS